MGVRGVVVFGVAVAGCAAQPVVVPRPAVSPAFSATTWTYGSGEAAAISLSAFGALERFVEAELPKIRKRGDYVSAVVGADGEGVSCSKETERRPAAIFDIDETVLLNLGHQYDQVRRARRYDEALWTRWEREGVGKVAPAPGAAEALRRLREQGVAVLFVSNRASATAEFTEAALNTAGLGPAPHLQAMLLQGDLPGGTAKDPRRAEFAKKFCVVALAGDQLGDFTDAIERAPGATDKRPLAERRALVAAGTRWGRGWFVLPNPMYGGWNTPPATLEDAVPLEKRWDPAPAVVANPPIRTPSR